LALIDGVLGVKRQRRLGATFVSNRMVIVRSSTLAAGPDASMGVPPKPVTVQNRL